MRWRNAGNKSPWVAVSTGKYGSIVKFGFNSFLDQFSSQLGFTNSITALNAKVWRDNWKQPWPQVEKSAGTFNWTDANTTKLVACASAASALGCEPLIPVGTTNSAWANGLHAGENAWTTPPATNYQAALSYFVTQVGSACNLYEICNEPNLNRTTAEYMNILNNTYDTVKTANPSAVVSCGVVLDPDHDTWYTDMITSSSNLWLTKSDAFSFHEYNQSGDGQTGNHKPEYQWFRARRAMDNVRRYRPSCRFWWTETSWNNGSTGSFTQAETAAYVSRLPFMIRTLPNLDIFTYYCLTDANSLNQGLFTSSYVAKTQAAPYGDALAELHQANGAVYYQHKTNPTHAVAMLRNDGTRRLALWGQSWKLANGTTEPQTDQSGNQQVLVMAASSGTLSIKTMGGSTITTPLRAGVNDITVAYTGTAVVLSADVAVAFVGMPCGGTPVNGLT